MYNLWTGGVGDERHAAPRGGGFKQLMLDNTLFFIQLIIYQEGTLLSAHLFEALHYKPEVRGFDS
jgi:hypothetical protein